MFMHIFRSFPLLTYLIILQYCLLLTILALIPFKKLPSIFFDDGSFSFIFRPTTTIVNPFGQIPNWIPAPIPQYTPAQYFPYVKVNQLLSMCNESYKKTVPEEPTMITYINNAVVFKHGQIMTKDFTWHHLLNLYQSLTKFKDEKSVNIEPLEVINQGIYFFHPFYTCYFHFIIETFPLIYSFGNEIISKSVLLHGRFMKHQFTDLCNILNITFKRVLFVGTPVFVKKLYISNPHFYDGCNPNALRHFRLHIFQSCNIVDIPSTQNIIYNRKRSRFIRNFDVMVDALKSELPEYNFTFLPDAKSIVDQAKFWRASRFAMMIHGSTLSNMIFMRPKAVVVEFARKDCRSTYVMLSHVLGIRLYEVMFRNQTKYYSMEAEPSILIPAVRSIMKMLDKEKLTEI